MLNGSFLTKKEQRYVEIFDYSNSKEYLVEPDVVEYNKKKMTKPVLDLILGPKTMTELEIVLDFQTKEIMIDHITLPIRDINSLTTSNMDRDCAVNNSIVHESQSTQEATQQVVHILDAKYEKEDPQSIFSAHCTLLFVTTTSYWSCSQNMGNFFDGTLGDWNTEPISCELKQDTKPYDGKSFPEPRVHKEAKIKELNRLCKLVVLWFQPTSEYASSSFITPMKDKTAFFIGDFREVNKYQVRKPFPIPKISTVLQELEGFTFATALGLNMNLLHCLIGI